jgi:WD40 repeat protein/serine/threonine protein kinase
MSDREDRLDEIILAYHEAADAGQAPDPQEFIARYPDLAEELTAYFAAQRRLDPFVAPFGGLATADLPLDRFDDYEVIEQIGHGGMGVVYRVRDSDLDRNLAVKVLRRDRQGNPQYEQRFQEEAQILGQLQHPGFVPIHRRGHLPDGRPYFTMKLVMGQTLAQLLHERQTVGWVESSRPTSTTVGLEDSTHPTPPADLPRLLTIFEQVCQTVAYAHSRHVLHRDLKPSNIMVGAFGEVQVMDWGLAKALPGGEPARAGRQPPDVPAPVISETVSEILPAPGDTPHISTQQGTALGTWAYMPPEQARGEVDLLDECCDVFSLGAILCEILTGQPPYTGPTLAKLASQAEEGDLTDAHARLAGCGAEAELVELARNCLARDRRQRPHDAGAVAEAVTAYQVGVQERLRQAEVERAAAGVKAKEERKRRRLAVGAGATIMLATLGALAGLSYFTAELQAERNTVRDERDRALVLEKEAREQQAETARQLDRTRRTLFTAQLWRAATVAEREPAQALRLLEDADACPPDLRDFAWRLYHRRCNRLRGKLDGHLLVRDMAFSPRGTLLATADSDGSVKLWDVANRQIFRILSGHENTVMAVIFNHDGTMLASGSLDGTVRLWDSAGNPLSILRGHVNPNSLAFSPDGKMLAVGECSCVRLWEVNTGRLRGTRKSKGEHFGGYSAAFTSDGTSLLAWNAHDCITFWDMATDTEIGSIPEKARDGLGSKMALSPDGKTVVAFHNQQVLNVWNAQTRMLRNSLKKNAGYRLRPVFTPDSRTLVVCDDQCATFLDLASGEPSFVLEAEDEIDCLAFSGHGALCATAHYDTVALWDVSANPWRDAPIPDRAGCCETLSRNGQYLTTHNKEGSLSLWSVKTGDRLQSIKAGMVPWLDNIQAMVTSNDGQRLALARKVTSKDGLHQWAEVILWDWSAGRETARLRLPWDSWTGVMEFSPDSRTLATGGTHGVVTLWDVADGSLKVALRGGKGTDGLLAFSANGKTLVSTSRGGELVLWNTLTGKRLPPIDSPAGEIYCVALSPDGQLLAVGIAEQQEDSGYKEHLRLWNVATGKNIFSHHGQETYCSVAFSHDGTTLAVGKGFGGSSSRAGCAVELWAMSTMQHRAYLRGHMREVDFVAFSPDGNSLVSRTCDWNRAGFVYEDIKIWEAEPVPR